MKKALVITKQNCQPCNNYKMLLRDAIDKGLNVEIVSLDDDPTLKDIYELKSVPTTIILDSNGFTMEKVTGSLSTNALQELLED